MRYADYLILFLNSGKLFHRARVNEKWMRAWANLQEAHPSNRGFNGKKFDICDAHPHLADYVSVVLGYYIMAWEKHYTQSINVIVSEKTTVTYSKIGFLSITL